MNCRVVVEAAVPVYDVETSDEAIRIAISKTGEMLNPDLNYVEINMGERTSPSGEELPPAFIAADEALVALELEMTVFNVERTEHASRIARKEIGQRLTNIPLDVLEVEVLDEAESKAVDETTDEDGDENDSHGVSEGTDEDGDENDSRGVGEGSDGTGTDEGGDEVSRSENGDDHGNSDSGTVEESADDILPEFEELIDE